MQYSGFSLENTWELLQFYYWRLICKFRVGVTVFLHESDTNTIHIYELFEVLEIKPCRLGSTIQDVVAF